MTCRYTQSLLEDFVDGSLPHERAAEIQDHLTACSDCQAEYSELRRLKELLKTYEPKDPGREYFQETTELILARTVGQSHTTDSGQPDRRERRDAFVRAVLSAAASLVVLFSAMAIGNMDSPGASQSNRLNSPVLATLTVIEGLNTQVPSILPAEDRARLAQGMLLMGPPGLLGKFGGLMELQHR